MKSTFLKSAIKNGLAKAGLSVSRSEQGVMIYRSQAAQRSILRSALINNDSFSKGEYSFDRLSHIVVDQTGLTPTDTGLTGSNLKVTLSGEEIQPAPCNSTACCWHWPDTLKNGVRTLDIRFQDRPGEETCDTYIIDFREEYQRLFGALYSTLITEPIMGIYMIGFRNNRCFAQGWVYDPKHAPAEQNFNLNGAVPTVKFSKSQPDWEVHIGPVSSYFTMKGDRHFSFFEAELETPCTKEFQLGKLR
jgi:hypothetical protein